MGDNRELVAEFEVQKDDVQLAEQQAELNAEQESEVENLQQPEEMVSSEKAVSQPQSDRKADANLTPWEQIGKGREPFYPFDNDVECFRIFPKDLNYLQPEYRLFQSNQFLMHGYYNYRHLIMFKKKDEADEYWLGVPGIYHEREKMAARMFGFEKFEAKNKDYKAGDLGYYLVTVK